MQHDLTPFESSHRAGGGEDPPGRRVRAEQVSQHLPYPLRMGLVAAAAVGDLSAIDRLTVDAHLEGLARHPKDSSVFRSTAP